MRACSGWLAAIGLIACGAEGAPTFRAPTTPPAPVVMQLPSAIVAPATATVTASASGSGSVDAEPSPPACDGSPMAIGIALDRSGSMTGLPLQMAKASASAVVTSLCDADLLELVAFDSSPMRIVAASKGSRRREMLSAIDSIQAGGGTALFPALDALYQVLIEQGVSRRHAVVITDGRFPTRGLDDLVDAMAADGVTVSTIALGQDADPVLLTKLANHGGGRFALVGDVTRLPSVLVKEVVLARADKTP